MRKADHHFVVQGFAMLLPDLPFLARIFGKASVGQVLIGKKVEGSGGNGAVHKILDEVLAGKPVTQKRMIKLKESIHRHLQGYSSEMTYQGPVAPIQDVNDPYRVSLLMYYGFAEGIKPTAPKFAGFLEDMVRASDGLSKTLKEGGIDAFANKLREIAEHPEAYQLAPVHLSAAQLAEGTNSEPKDAIEILQLFGLTCLICVYLADRLENDAERLRSMLRFLFCAQDKTIAPELAFSRWLSALHKETGINGKMEFIHKAFGPSETEVRTAHKIFAGTDIPTFHAGEQILYRLGFLMDEDDTARKQGLALVISISRTAQKLASLSDSIDPNIVPQTIFETMLAQLEKWASKDLA